MIIIDLSRNIIKRYVEVATPEKITSNSETVNGTVVSEGDVLYVRIDGSSILTPVSSTIDIREGDRVLVLLKNHEATVIGSPTSATARLEELRELGGEVVDLVNANKVVAGEIVAMQGLFEELTAKDVEITGELSANKATIEALTAENATINGKLTAYQADIEELRADKIDATAVEAKYATIESLNATNADITNLEADYADFKSATADNLTAINAEIDDLDATYATIVQLDAEKARITDLEATRLTADSAEIKNLQADVADIDTLIFGSASGTTIQSSFANAVIAQLGNAQIKSAMIDSLSASKIAAGDILTNNVRVLSEDGKLLISDETIQISDDARVRVQIGKDASNDYSINVWDASGKLMFSKGGITDAAIKDAIIRDDMVSDTANIKASKLDISSLFTEINNSTETINSNKVLIDTDAGTLDVAFTKMSSDIDDISEEVTTQGTALSVVQGQISSKVWLEDIKETDLGEVEESITTLESQYSALNQTVSGISATVGQHTTQIANKADNSTVTAVSNKVTQVETNLEGFKTSVSNTYQTKDAMSGYSTTSQMNSEIEQSAASITSTVSSTYATKTALSATDTKAVNAQKAADDAQDTADQAVEDLGSLTTRVTNAESSITQNATQISQKVSSTDFNTYKTTVTSNIATAKSEAISAAATDATTKANNAKDAAISAAATDASTKADNAKKAANEYTDGKVQTVTTEVNTVKNTVAEHTTSLNSISSRVATTESNVTTINGNVSSLTSRMSAAEQKITDEAIINTVSSTYATKSALATTDTKAANAQADIDNLEVGGRNLILDTKTEPSAFGVNTKYWSGYGTWEYVSDYKDGFCAAHATDIWSGAAVYLNQFIDEFNVGDSMTFSVSIDNTTETEAYITFYFMQFDNAGTRVYLSNKNSMGLGSVPAGGSTRMSITYELEQAIVDNINSGGTARLTMQLSTSDSYSAYFYAPKLEKGNKATDWTPAPEDVDADITDARDTANAAQSATEGLENRMEIAESTILQLSNSISQFVRDANGSSLVQQDANGLTYYNLSDIQEAIGNNSDGLNALDALVGAWEEYCKNEGNEGTTLTQFISNMKGTLDAHGLTLEYVHTGTYTNSETGNKEPCIELGESDSDFKLLITNTRIVFMEGSTETTYIKDNTLVTNNVEVKNELRQGGWVWTVRQNGNYGLTWKEA